MGASQTKSETLNQVLNEVSIDVLNQNSTSSSAYSDQSNDLIIAANTGGTVAGVTQINSAKINVSALQTSAASGNLQSALTAALSNKIAQEGAALGYSASEAQITNVVSSKVNTTITNKNLLSIATEAKQSNAVQILGNNNANILPIVQKNEAELIAKLVANMNSDVVSALQTSGVISTDLTQKVPSLLPELTVGLVFFLVFAVAAAYLFKGTFDNLVTNITKPAPMLLIAGILVAIFVIKV